MLGPDGRRVLPPGWRPPTPLSLVVHYWQDGRDPDALWSTPWLVDEDGAVVLYLAAGPAGQPFGTHLTTRVDLEGLPGSAQVQVVLDKDRSGRLVYGAPMHTPN